MGPSGVEESSSLSNDLGVDSFVMVEMLIELGQ